MDAEGFRRLLGTVAEAWNEGDTTTALACFAENARYTEPPDTQHYEGRQALYEFFGGEDPPPMRMEWHTIVFDDGRQMGAGEYTYRGTNTYHGVVVVQTPRRPHRQLARVPAPIPISPGRISPP